MVNKTFSKYLICWGLTFLIFFLVFKAAYAQEKSNYALVIGIENYEDKSWPRLSNAISDATRVGNELEKKGFVVTYRSNLNLIDLETEIKKFFYDEKINENSSLFLWFSGQSHNVGEEDFLVPSDAPGKNDPGFKLKAFPVRRFDEYLRVTNAKHVFLVFDACFSNMDFMIESSDSTRKTVSEMQKYPVRQYLCSCPTDRQKKEDVTFGEMFARTMRDENKADTNGDNYLTAGEIIIKMTEALKIPALKFGKLKGYDQGEFVFSLPGQSRRYFRDRLKDGIYGPEMNEIPGGSFMMGDSQGKGSRDEKPVHVVNIPAIAVSRCEITFDEYELFCKKNNRRCPGDKIIGNRPVTDVSWQDANDYILWLSEQTNSKYRLPTEAEWEYFARAGTDTDYWWGNEIGNGNASCDGCRSQWGWDATKKSKKTTAPVKSFNANPFGIYDTVGNVWEWTCSEYTPGYNESKKEENCLEIIKSSWKLVVLRGGAWNEKPESCRVSRRKIVNPGERSPYIGFRVVKELK